MIQSQGNMLKQELFALVSYILVACLLHIDSNPFGLYTTRASLKIDTWSADLISHFWDWNRQSRVQTLLQKGPVVIYSWKIMYLMTSILIFTLNGLLLFVIVVENVMLICLLVNSFRLGDIPSCRNSFIEYSIKGEYWIFPYFSIMRFIYAYLG